MADTKSGRDQQADDEERRQRERELAEARDRGDEAEPQRDVPDQQLGDLDDALERLDYPATTDELIEAYGDREVESQAGTATLAELFGPIDDELFDSADDVRNRTLRLLRRR